MAENPASLRAFPGSPQDSPDTGLGVRVLTRAGESIRAIIRFHLDQLYPRFGFPISLPETMAQPRSRLATAGAKPVVRDPPW